MTAVVAVHLDKKKPNKFAGFRADQLGWSGWNDADGEWGQHHHEYTRKVPAHFSDPNNDDRFMHSMITNYAIEERDDNGHPTGKFYIDEENALAASREVVGTHLHLSGKKLEDYLDYNFADTWNYYNAAGDGKIEPDRMSTFFRMLCKDANLNL